jgi:O-antigen/teichoic acid export membrane protein
MRFDHGTDIASQTAWGSLYAMAGTGVTITLGFVRSVLLARLLLPEHFGVVALALFFVSLSTRLTALGLDRALLHRQVTEGPVHQTYLTLKLLVTAATTLLVILLAPVAGRFHPEQELFASVLIALGLVAFVSSINQTQEVLLENTLDFKSLALINVTSSMAMTVVSPWLAWRGWGVWSLVAEAGSGVLARAVLVWGPLRVTPPSVGFDPAVARWFWQYGRASWFNANLGFLVERFGDFWVGIALGQRPLGYYTRAREFAHYPRRLVGTPLVTVLAPVFARLQHERLDLSRAYFRLTGLLVRAGFLAGGLALLLAPEFVFRILGPTWAPMVRTFQLMLVYMLLDPVLMAAGYLLLAVGAPAKLARVRMGQLAFFVPAAVLGAHWGGIEGVALATGGMLLVGLFLLHGMLREHVDYSFTRLFRWPALAAVLGLLGAALLVGVDGLDHPQPLAVAGGKAAIFGVIFGSILLGFERRETAAMVRVFWSSLRRGADRVEWPQA